MWATRAPKRSIMRSLEKLFRFSFVGLVGTGIDFIFFSIAMTVGAMPGCSRATGYVAGSSWAFIANRKWVFPNSWSISVVWKFAVTYCLSGMVAVLIQSNATSTNTLSMESVLFFFVSVILATAINFSLLSLWVFRSKLSKKKGEGV